MIYRPYFKTYENRVIKKMTYWHGNKEGGHGSATNSWKFSAWKSYIKDQW
jgi:hypothetical protein